MTQHFRPGRAWLMDHAKRFAWDGIVSQWLGLVENMLGRSRFQDAAERLVTVRGGNVQIGDGNKQSISYVDSGKKGKNQVYAERHRTFIETGVINKKPILHVILTEYATGGRPIDPLAFEANDHWGGGCRAGFMGLVKAASKHFDVRAISQFTTSHRDGDIDYTHLGAGGGSVPDAVLAYYDTTPLQHYNDPKTLRIASHHTYLPPCQNFDFADVNVAPSEHAMRTLKATWDPLGDWDVLPNALPASLANVVHRPVSGRVIYHTSPDRGLAGLLTMWPEIRRRVPHATLHVVGDVEVQVTGYYSQLALSRSVRGRRSRELMEAREAALAAGGVEFLGTLSRARVLEELSQAACFAFPCSVSQPCETFSISIMECIRIGVPVVLRPADALAEIYDDKVAGWADEVEWQEEFVGWVVRVLHHHSTNAAHSKEWASSFTFESAASALFGIYCRHVSVPTPSVSIPKYVPVSR